MTAIYPIQSTFSGGELSPRLSARTDTERYRQSVETYTNFYSLPQGSAFRRPGSEFVFQTLNNGPARLVDFGRGREQDYVVEFTDGNVRMYNRDGVVQAQGGELLVNGEFKFGSNNLLGWTVGGNFEQEVQEGGESVNKEVITFEASSPQFEVTQLEGAIGENGLPAPPPKNFLNLEQEVDAGAGPYTLQTLSTQIFFTGENNLWRVQLLVGDGTTEDAYIDTTFFENGTFAVDFTPTGPTITIKYYFFLNGTPQGSIPQLVTIQNLSLRAAVDDPLILASPYSESQLAEFDSAMDLGGDDTGPDRLWIVHPDVEPHILTRVSENNWTLAPAVFIAPPPDWGANNYPSTIDLFSGRSWFSGVPNSRAQLWGSRAGNYFDFTTGSNPGDSLDLQLVTRGAIQWVKGQKALLLGTDLAEHTVTSSQSFAIPQVGDVDVREQSSYGSVNIEPLIIGNEVVYLSPDRTKLYATDYLRDNDGWMAFDLTWFAEHITKAGILRHVWARDPDNQLICIMIDGTITHCVYDRRREMIAWSRFITDGSYISGCATSDVSGSSKWYCVKRGDNYYIETVQAGEINHQYCDSWIAQPTVNKAVNNLEHLEGKTVQVTVNGAIEPDQVVTGGSITTKSNGNAVVGLRYEATLKTLRQEGGNQAGTSQGSLMGFSSVVLRLNNSAVPKVDGQLPSIRTPSVPMNTATPLTTGDSETWQLGRQSKGQIVITQDLPLRTEIVAIYGKLRSNTV